MQDTEDLEASDESRDAQLEDLKSIRSFVASIAAALSAALGPLPVRHRSGRPAATDDPAARWPTQYRRARLRDAAELLQALAVFPLHLASIGLLLRGHKVLALSCLCAATVLGLLCYLVLRGLARQSDD